MKKFAADNLSSAGGKLCGYNTYDAYHAAGMFKMAFNDPAEIYLITMTFQIQSYGKIRLPNAGGFSQLILKGDLSRGFDTGCKKIPNGCRGYSISSQRRLGCLW